MDLNGKEGGRLDRDQRSRRQKSSAPPPRPPRQKQPPRRSMKSRLGLTKPGENTAPRPSGPVQRPAAAKRPRDQQPAHPSRPAPNAGRPSGTPTRPAPRPEPRRTIPQGNPQKPGYRQNPAARPARRVTHAEQLRRRRRRAVLGMLLVLAALIGGIILSVNLLFKVTDYRVENVDGSTPANTGVYTEQQIIDLLGVPLGENLFGFSTAEKSDLLLAALPYLDVAKVNVQMPGTVVVKVQPATERFMMEYGGQWLILSDGLKVLRTDATQPDGLILLEVDLPAGQPVQPGAFLDLDPVTTDGAATAETAHTTTRGALDEIMEQLEAYGLQDNVSVITLTDVSELSFLYQGRVSVKLGTANNLEYKIRFAARLILDVEGNGLSATDRGTLDVSRQQSDGSIQATFNSDTSTPAPAQTPEPDPSGAQGTEQGDGGEAGDSGPAQTPEPQT